MRACSNLVALDQAISDAVKARQEVDLRIGEGKGEEREGGREGGRRRRRRRMRRRGDCLLLFLLNPLLI